MGQHVLVDTQGDLLLGMSSRTSPRRSAPGTSKVVPPLMNSLVSLQKDVALISLIGPVEILRQAGIDIIWFGIFIVVVVEMAQITPPIGFNLFVLQGMTRHEINYIAVAALPMFLIMVVMVFVLIAFPDLATWLPENMRTRPG